MTARTLSPSSGYWEGEQVPISKGIRVKSEDLFLEKRLVSEKNQQNFLQKTFKAKAPLPFTSPPNISMKSPHLS